MTIKIFPVSCLEMDGRFYYVRPSGSVSVDLIKSIRKQPTKITRKANSLRAANASR